MRSTTISSDIARRMALNAQFLNGKEKSLPGSKSVLETINQLGYIQIDTIAVINRSHHHTLWTRNPDYNESIMHQLQAKDRKVFEYWGHAMSYIPMSDYRYFLPRMKNFQNPNHSWIQHRLGQDKSILKHVLDRIRDEGPLGSKDFERSKNQKAGTWWDWKPSKFALEILFWRGDLMITERRKFQKIYDLRERVLPKDIDTTLPEENDVARFLVKRALLAHGIATEKEIQKFMQPDTSRDSDWQAVSREVISKAIDNLVESNEINTVYLEDEKEKVNYILKSNLADLNDTVENHNEIYFLSPFDNLIIQRERVKRLFGFDYTLECYVPASKRKYGYFVLPILWKNKLMGRIDPKADRKSKTMIINNLHFEPEFKISDEFLLALKEKMIDFSEFNQCTKIKLVNVTPSKFKPTIKSKIKS